MHDYSTLRQLGRRIEGFFDWYRRQEPDVVPEVAAEVVASFVSFSKNPSRDDARRLLVLSEGVNLGTLLWQEMRLALAEMARR